MFSRLLPNRHGGSVLDMPQPEEVWLPITRPYGCTRYKARGAFYEVSNLGRIRRGSRILRLTLCGRKPAQRLCASFHIDGKSKKIPIHLLIAEAFLGPRPHGRVTCHNNGNHLDNRADNLRYDTPAGNESDKLEHGTKAQGTSHGGHKLTEAQVLSIRSRAKLLGDALNVAATAKEFRMSRGAIVNIIDGNSWRHLL